MKKISKAFALILSCLIFASSLVFNTSAAASISKIPNLTVGQEFTVTVNVSANEAMYAISGTLNYDASVLQFISGEGCSGGAGVVTMAVGGTGNSNSIKCKFKAIKAGSCTVSTADLLYVNIDAAKIALPNQSTTATVNDKTLSGNCNLKSLSLSAGTLSPQFSASTTSYDVSVGNSVLECKVYATAQDKGASVRVSGGNDLKLGANNVTITVTAPSGAQKVYKIKVTRLDYDPEPEVNPLETVVDSVIYTVSNNLEGITIPNNFKTKVVKYNDIDVTVVTDQKENLEIYYLNSTENPEYVPYTLDKKTGVFKKLSFLSQGDKFYVLSEIPSKSQAPEGYYLSNTKIGGFDISCYASNNEKMSAFYYVYCNNGEDFEFYRYDSKEQVLQRYPEMKLISISDKKDGENKGFIQRFDSLSNNAKIVVIGLALVVLGVIALIVLLILRFVNQHKIANSKSDIDLMEEFDTVNYTTDFALEDSEYNEDEIAQEIDFSQQDEAEAAEFVGETDDEDQE